MKRLTPEGGLVAAVTVLAVAYLWADSRLPSHSIGDPLGPRVFPALVGIGLLVSALLIALELRAARRKAAPGDSEPARAPAPAPARAPTHAGALVGTAAWLALYYAAMEPVGYLLSTFVFLAGLLGWFNRGRWRTNAIVAVTFTLVVDALFTHALGVPLAEGILHL